MGAGWRGNGLPTAGHGRASKRRRAFEIDLRHAAWDSGKGVNGGYWTAGESPQRSQTILRRINSPLCALSLSGPCPTTLNTYSLGKVTWEKLQAERFVLYSSFRWTRGLIFYPILETHFLISLRRAAGLKAFPKYPK